MLNNVTNWSAERNRDRCLPATSFALARLILALEDGLSHREIERRLGASAPTVSLWNGRFEESGVAGFALYPASSADRSGSGM